MFELDQIPAFERDDLEHGTCSLTVISLGTVSTLEEAWAMLPTGGEGVVVKSDQIVRYSASRGQGLMLDAEVVQDRDTYVVRCSGQQWRGWKWTEGEGDSHRYVQHTYLSSETTTQREASPILYRQYWELAEQDDIEVWRPLGSRFCGFQEKK